METQTTVCVPDELGIDVHSSTNWMDLTQIAVAECLKIPEKSVNIVVRHIGGSYGAKITRASYIACACAIGCYLTNRPVRFVTTIESNMSVIGKRYALYDEYKANVDSSTGKIQKLENVYIQDYGCSYNDSVQSLTLNAIKNCYISDTWTNRPQSILTDAPSHTLCRAPGSLEGIAMTENIMEHIAWSLGIEPLSVRLANISADSPINQMIPGFLKSCG